MAFDHPTQCLRRQHLHRVSPLVKVPNHFEPAGGVEPDDQRAVWLILELLARVEDEGAYGVGCGGREAPDHLAVARLFLIGAEGTGGMGRDVEAGLPREARLELTRGADARRAVREVAVLVSRDKIAVQSESTPSAPCP